MIPFLIVARIPGSKRPLYVNPAMTTNAQAPPPPQAGIRPDQPLLIPPTAEEQRGIDWWNARSQSARAAMLESEPVIALSHPSGTPPGSAARCFAVFAAEEDPDPSRGVVGRRLGREFSAD